MLEQLVGVHGGSTRHQVTKVLTARTFRTAQGFQPLLLGPLETLLDRDLVGGPAVAPISAMFARELPILTAVPWLLDVSVFEHQIEPPKDTVSPRS